MDIYFIFELWCENYDVDPLDPNAWDAFEVWYADEEADL